MIRLLAADTSLWAGDVWVVDSTPIECGRSRETAAAMIATAAACKDPAALAFAQRLAAGQPPFRRGIITAIGQLLPTDTRLWLP